MKYRTQIEEWLAEYIGIGWHDLDDDTMIYERECKVLAIIEDLDDEELIDLSEQHLNGYAFESIVKDIVDELSEEMTACVITRADRIRLGEVDPHETLAVNITTLLDLYERAQMSPSAIDKSNPTEVYEAEWVITRVLEFLRGEIPEADKWS